MSTSVKPKTHRLRDGTLVTLREADPADAAALIAHINRVAGESDNLSRGAGEFDISPAEEADIIRKFGAAENQLFLVAVVEDDIIGDLTFSAGRRPRVRHSGELGMSVIKPYWGKGVGSLLLDGLIDWARASAVVKKLNLRVRTDNERALRLYRRKGFVEEGRQRKELFIDGDYHDLYMMGLLVGEDS